MLIKTIRNLVSTSLKVIAPPMCAFCKTLLAEREILCAQCMQSIMPIASITVPISTNYDMTVHAISGYYNPIKHLIIAKSSQNIHAPAQLARLMWELTCLRYLNVDCFVPIPLHWSRYAYRGFNQAAEMAHLLSSYKNSPVLHLLSRTRRTPFQSKVVATQRASNVADAFAVNLDACKDYQHKHLMLVDDLMTTGSTLQAAAKQLVKLKPASINAIVAARV